VEVVPGARVRVRLALLGDWFLPRLGGIELQVRDLAVRLKERGHDVEIITPVEGADRVDGIRVHRLGAPRLPRAGIIYTAQAFRRMRELLARGRYDAVQVHFGIVAPAAYGGAHIAMELGLPTVAVFHSVLRHFEVPLWLVRGAMGVRDWRVQWGAVSSVVAHSIRPLVGDSPVAILPNGVDAAWWARPGAARQGEEGRSDVTLPDGERPVGLPLQDGERHRDAIRPITAVAVMRLHRRKRPLALLDAVASVVAELPPERRLAVRIVGDGGERQAMERAIARKNLDDVVTMCGWLPPETVRAEHHAADVFLMPSRLEAFGIAALEARCAGLPVVTMAGSGARDFLEHGRDALLAADDAAFAEHLRALVLDDALRARLTAACAAPPPIADWDAVLDRHEELLSVAVESRRATSLSVLA